MRAVLGLALMVAAIGPANAYAQASVSLRKPTVLILKDTRAQMARLKDDYGYSEGSGDFAAYANRMEVALKQHPEIMVKWSSAATVAFPGTKLKSIVRSTVGNGWGYVFYRPGREPVVIEGVAIDDQLVCVAAKLYEVTFDGYSCGA